MKKRWLCLVLAILMVLPFFVSCDAPAASRPEKPSADTGDPLPKGALALAEKGEARFSIVYPRAASEDVKSSAQRIVDGIAAATGVEIPVKHDFAGEGAHEIRLGKVSRTDAISVYSAWSKLGSTDYAVAVKGGHIYLYGTSAGAIDCAVSYFLDRMLKTSADWAAVDGAESERVFAESDRTTVAFADFDGTHASFAINAGDYSESRMRVSLTLGKGWRIQTCNASGAYNDMGAAQRLAAALGEDAPLTTLPIEMTRTDTAVTLSAQGHGSVTVDLADFRVDVYTPDGDCAASITKLYVSPTVSVIEGSMEPGESVYGTGERFNAADQRGKRIHMFTKDMWSRADASYMVIPFLAFSRGSGVLLNNYEEMTLSLGDAKKKAQTDTWRAEICDSPIDCYVFATERMSDAISAYTDLTGHAEMPPEWSYGMLICRNSPDLSQPWSEQLTNKTENSEGRVPVGVYDMIAYMEAYDLPWTGLILEGWGGSGSVGKYRKLEELCDYVHSLGKKVLLYMHVGVAKDGMPGFSKDFLLPMIRPDGTVTTDLPASADGNNPDVNGTEDRLIPYLDVTNPFAVDWFFGEHWDYVANEIGVDGCKIDFCEELPEYYELDYFDDTVPTVGSHHWYPTVFCSMYWGMISSKPDGGMCYTRGGGIGSQRAPYMWAGDQTRRYTSLQWQLTSVLSSGLSGVPFMSYDMSGYQYGNNYQDSQGISVNVRDAAYEAQVFIRGLQFTAFTVSMQTHGKVRNAFEFAAGDIATRKLYYCKETETYTEDKTSTVDGKTVHNEFDRFIPKTTEGFDPKTGKEIGTDYVYEIEPGEMSYVTDIYRAYVKLHELLTPYITEYSEIACETGMPLMRHLALGWQDDPTARATEDEYTFGDAFLVAPVLNDRDSRDIYLPAGVWRDLNTGERHEVGADGLWIKDYSAPLTVLPVFYNENNTSKTAEALLPGIAEIFAYTAQIEVLQ